MLTKVQVRSNTSTKYTGSLALDIGIIVTFLPFYLHYSDFYIPISPFVLSLSASL
jgi:hypothetical protein